MENLLTVEEVAPLVRLSEQGLYRAIREGQFPAVRIGSKIRIPESAVCQFVAAQIGEKTNAQESVNSFQAVN